MKKVLKRIVLLMAILVVATGMMMPQEALAKTKKKATVKSVVVTNVKSKKLSLYTGKTFKLKVKVNVSGKISKAVTYASSNKKVATVTKKGVIKAVSKGTAKITVTSKANKKKKTTITVTVKNPVKIASLNVKNGDTLEFKLSEAYKLTSDKIVVYSKVSYYGSYVYKPVVLSVVTKDNINYVINIDVNSSLVRNEMVKLTVKGLPGTGDASKEAILRYQSYTRENDVYYKYEVGTAINHSRYIGDSAVSVKGLPSGCVFYINNSYYYIKAEKDALKAGTYKFDVTVKKYNGDTEVYHYSFIVYDDSKIYVTDNNNTYCMSSNSVGSVYLSASRSVAGSSSYKYELDTASVPQDVKASCTTSGSINVQVEKAGTYSFNVKVTDVNDSNKTAIIKMNVKFINSYNLNCKCNIDKEISYNTYAKIIFISYGNEYFEEYSTERYIYDGAVSTSLLKGKYHVVFCDGYEKYYSVGDINVTDNNENITFNITKK